MSTPHHPEHARAQDIEQQLDELLAQLMQQEPGVVPGTEHPGEHPGEIPVEHHVTEPTAAAHPPQPKAIVEATDPTEDEAMSPTAADEAEDDTSLEASLTALLQEVAAKPSDPAPAAPRRTPPPPPPPVTASPTTATTLEDELASQIQALLDDAKAAEAGGAASEAADIASLIAPRPGSSAADAQPAGEASDMPIQAIDEMLAEAADDAVAGDFETVDQVLSPQPQAVSSSTAAVPPSVEAAMHAPPAGGEDDADADAVEGSFQTPEDLMMAQTAPPQGAAQSHAAAAAAAGSAAAVAAELSEPTPDRKPRQPKSPKAARSQRSIVIVCDHKIRRTMGLVNRPLDYVSPSIRNAIGLIGAANVLIGAAMLLYSMLHAVS